MKSIKITLGFLLLVLLGLSSCKDEFSVDLSNRQYVRLNNVSISITPGEKFIIKAKPDSLGGASKTFNWIILDPDIASVEPIDNQSAIITGLSEGTSVVKIESTDGQLKYFSDLTVGKERVFKILAIGNSFSEDAVENYLFDLADAAGHKVMIGNMYIGGQSLEGHWRNASENNPAYQLRLIGTEGSLNSFDEKTIMDAVTQENWDYISFQEVSQLSGIIDGYHLNLGLGRFTAASTWFEALFGGVLDNPFEPQILTGYDTRMAKTAAYQAVSNPEQVTDLVDFKYPAPNEFILKVPLFIDFGEAESPAPFNNFKNPNDVKIGGLKDFTGVNTNFAIEVTENFTGTLSRQLRNILGLPQSVSEDMFFSDGVNIPQSSLTLSNLNREQAYTLVFYGSVNDNKTETEFNVVGKNEKTGYLDNDNNLGKLVILEGIQPADDATITIKMRPGPNNDHFAGFFGVNAMMVLPEGMDVPVNKSTFELAYPVYVDFGKMAPPAPFYNFGENTDAPRFDLTDEKGVNTGFAMSITARFSGKNESGEMSNTIGLPQEVGQDAFYGDKNNPVTGFTLYNLNPEKKYQFIFYGSRRDASDMRETMYEVIGSNNDSAMLETANNTSEVAIVNGIQPTESGIIDIRISAGPNNNNADPFYYINAMIITPEGYILPGM